MNAPLRVATPHPPQAVPLLLKGKANHSAPLVWVARTVQKVITTNNDKNILPTVAPEEPLRPAFPFVFCKDRGTV